MDFMKRIMFIVVIAFCLAMASGCKAAYRQTEQIDLYEGGVHMNCIEGKIMELKDENEILLEITKERGGYQKGDRVLVKYNDVSVINTKTGDKTSGSLQIDDEVGVGFWPEKVKQKDGYDYITVDSVSKHTDGED